MPLALVWETPKFRSPAGRCRSAKPAVILVAMEVFGLHEYVKDVVRRLAKLGAFAIAPVYYFRKGADLTKITDFNELIPIVNAKPDAELVADLDATVAWAKSQGGDASRLGIAGFCRGGRTAWVYAAHSNVLKAGVAFYGSLVDPQNPAWPKSPIELAPEMKAPVLGLYGEADQGVPVSQVEEMKDALKAAGKTAEIKNLSRRPAWISRGLPSKLPEGSRGRRVAENGSLVQEIQGLILIGAQDDERQRRTSHRQKGIGDRRRRSFELSSAPRHQRC
jgi:dienelactone hydrolase